MFENFIAKHKMGSHSYNEDQTLTLMIKEILKKRWVSVSRQLYLCTITTDDGIELTFWDSNRYYAWAKRGCIKYNGGTFNWDDQRPSYSVMYQLKQKLLQFELQKITGGESNERPNDNLSLRSNP